MLILPTPSTRADSPTGFLTNALIAHYTFPGDARDRSQFSHDAVASSITYVTDRFIINLPTAFPMAWPL